MRRGLALDWTIVLLGTASTEWAVLVSTGIGNPVAGRRWLTVLWPLLLDLPLAWRAPGAARLVPAGAGRDRRPSTRDGQHRRGSGSALPARRRDLFGRGLRSRRQALAGLVALIAGYAVFAGDDRNVRSGESGERGPPPSSASRRSRSGSQASGCTAGAMHASWRGGLRRSSARRRRRSPTSGRGWRASCTTSSRTTSASSSSRPPAPARPARARRRSRRSNAADAKHLSRCAACSASCATDGRRSRAALAPQPGLARARDARRDDPHRRPAVELADRRRLRRAPRRRSSSSVYRIVQEALTNALKHAGPARAKVIVVPATAALSRRRRSTTARHHATPRRRRRTRADRDARACRALRR